MLAAQNARGKQAQANDGGLRLTSLLSLLVSDLYRTDRQADHQLWSLSGERHSLSHFLSFPLLLNQTVPYVTKLNELPSPLV